MGLVSQVPIYAVCSVTAFPKYEVERTLSPKASKQTSWSLGSNPLLSLTDLLEHASICLEPF